VARSSSKAAGKRPLDEGASQREGQGSCLRMGGALNIGAEEATRKRWRAVLDSDEEDEVPLSRVFRVRLSSPEQTPPGETSPPRTTAPETMQTGRRASPPGPLPRAPTPPRAGADAAPTRTGGADSRVPEQQRTSAEERTQGGSGSTGGRSEAGRRFRSSFWRSDM
jgi:hypothetical protein